MHSEDDAWAKLVPPDGGIYPKESWDEQFPFSQTSGSSRKRWCPRLNFENLIKFEQKDDWFRVHPERDDLQGGPVVCYCMQIRGVVFHEIFDLADYPFDSQKLHIRIRSTRPILDSVPSLTLAMNGQRRCVAPADDYLFTLRDEYIISSGIEGTPGETQREHSTSVSRRKYPSLKLFMSIQRRPEFYRRSFYLPVFVMVVLACSVVMVPRK